MFAATVFLSYFCHFIGLPWVSKADAPVLHGVTMFYHRNICWSFEFSHTVLVGAAVTLWSLDLPKGSHCERVWRTAARFWGLMVLPQNMVTLRCFMCGAAFVTGCRGSKGRWLFEIFEDQLL